MPVAFELPGRELGQAELDAYERDGFVALGKVLDDDEIEVLLAEERRFRPPMGYGSTTLLVSVQLCDRSAPIREVCCRGRHLRAVSQLVGPHVCLTHTQLLTKLPDDDSTTSEIAFHQDNGYGRLEPMTDVTVWIALTAAVQANGGLRMVAGSHRGGLLDHGRDDANRALRRSGDGTGSIAVDLQPGEAVAFSGLTVHGSGPNRTAAERVGFYARYCVPSTVMVSDGGRPVLDDPHSWMVAGHA